MNNINLVGVTSSTPARSGDKFRATWVFFGASIFPSFIYDAPDTAERLRERLPGLGFIPISNPSALPGDEGIVYDLQLSQTWGTARPVSEIVNVLADLPAPFTNLTLTRLEKITALSSVDLAIQQAQAHEEAQEEASSNALFSGVGNVLGIAGNTLVLVLVVGVAVAAYVLAKKA